MMDRSRRRMPDPCREHSEQALEEAAVNRNRLRLQGGSLGKDSIMKVVLAYSGGLDTTVLLTWLQETFDAEVICYCANLGQEEELDGLEEKALQHGAVKCFVDNVEETFAADYIYPMMQANAVYEGTYLLGTSIARPLIAKRMVDIAIEEGAEAICHGATGKGNDQVRFELTA